MFGNKKGVEVTSTNTGSHGDHWAGIFGFENDEHAETQIQTIVENLEHEKKIGRKTFLYRNRYGMASSIGVQVSDTLVTLYPAFYTSKVIPVSTRSIKEWSHSECVEAQITGSGRDTFFVDFFATDYVQNKKKYQSGKVMNVALSAVAYVVDHHIHEDDSVMSAEMCAYMPNTDGADRSEFDFIGKVLSVGEISFASEELLVLDVRLINDETDSNFFNLPVVVNRKNMRIDHVDQGDMITGCFWLQGRLPG